MERPNLVAGRVVPANRTEKLAELIVNSERLLGQSRQPGPAASPGLFSAPLPDFQEQAAANPAWCLPLISFAIQASLRCHLWTFMHAGQRGGIDKSSNESSTIVSVLRPVLTGFRKTGQLIKISGMGQHHRRCYKWCH